MCEVPEFDAEAAVASNNREVTRLTELVAALEDRLDLAESGAPGRRGRERSVDGVDARPGELDDDHPSIRELVEAAPLAMRDEVRRFARQIVEDGEVARQKRPPRSAAENLRVVGGSTVPPGAFLHCVCIGVPHWGCTGVVVAPQIVLTAAHCGDSIDRIMAGGTTVAPALSADARVVRVRQVTVHPHYADEDNAFDINVLILDAPALVPAAPLASAAEIEAATAFDVVGFGYNDPTRPIGFGTKRRATIPGAAIMARGEQDLGALPATLGFHPEYEFVAGRKHLGIDSCDGDSGGPLYVSAAGAFKVAGLTSRATRTALDPCGHGGIYVRPDKFRAWIDEVAADAGVAPIAA